MVDELGLLLPLPTSGLARPQPSSLRHSTQRQRFRRKLEVWRVAMGYVATLNQMNRGSFLPRTKSLRKPALSTITLQAQEAALQHALQEAASFVKRRRDLGLTGAHATASLLGDSEGDLYSISRKGLLHVPLDPWAIAEPTDDRVVDMLEALPPEDRDLYAEEINGIDPVGKSKVIFEELEARFRFLGGTLENLAA